MDDLTDAQVEVWNYIVEFYNNNDQIPPCPYISKSFGWSSPNAAHCHIKALEKKGYLERNEVGRYRFTR